MGANAAADVEDHGVSLLAAPLYHVAGLTSLVNALWTGRRTHLLPQFEPGAWLQAVAHERVTHAFLVPTLPARMLDTPQRTGSDPSSRERLTYGTAPRPPASLRRALAPFPPPPALSRSTGPPARTATRPPP